MIYLLTDYSRSAQNLVMNNKLVEFGVKNGDRLFVSRRDFGTMTQVID